MQRSETFPLKVQKIQKIKVFSKKILKAFIWTRLMQFWQPLAKVFSQKPKIFWSKFWEDWKTITVPKKILNLFPWTLKLRFRKPYSKLFVERNKNFTPNDQNGSLKAQKVQEIHHFQMCSSSKTSSGHEEWSSEKHTANFLPKVQEIFCSKDDKVSPKAREVLRNHSSFTNFTSSMSASGHAECFFGKPCRNLFPQVPNFFTQSTKLLRNLLFSYFFSQNFSADTRLKFQKPCRKRLAEVNNDFAQSAKRYEKSSFLQYEVLTIFLWTRRMQFWQPLPNLLCPNLKKFRLN